MNKIENLKLQSEVNENDFTEFKFDDPSNTIVLQVKNIEIENTPLVFFRDQVGRMIRWIENLFNAEAARSYFREQVKDETGDYLAFSVSDSMPDRVLIFCIKDESEMHGPHYKKHSNTNCFHSKEQVIEMLDWLKKVKEEMEKKK